MDGKTIYSLISVVFVMVSVSCGRLDLNNGNSQLMRMAQPIEDYYKFAGQTFVNKSVNEQCLKAQHRDPDYSCDYTLRFLDDRRVEVIFAYDSYMATYRVYYETLEIVAEKNQGAYPTMTLWITLAGRRLVTAGDDGTAPYGKLIYLLVQ